jgi:hypothetical protein
MLNWLREAGREQRELGMAMLRGYLVIPVLLLFVKAVQLGGG